MLIFVNGVRKCSSVLFAEMVHCLWIHRASYKVEIARGDNVKECVCEERKGSKTEASWQQYRVDGQTWLVQLYLSRGQEV